jgi:hypothetical protein
MKKFWINKKWRLIFIGAIAFLFVLLPLTVLAKQIGDGSVLPFSPVPLASVATSTLQEPTHKLQSNPYHFGLKLSIIFAAILPLFFLGIFILPTIITNHSFKNKIHLIILNFFFCFGMFVGLWIAFFSVINLFTLKLNHSYSLNQELSNGVFPLRITSIIIGVKSFLHFLHFSSDERIENNDRYEKLVSGELLPLWIIKITHKIYAFSILLFKKGGFKKVFKKRLYKVFKLDLSNFLIDYEFNFNDISQKISRQSIYYVGMMQHLFYTLIASSIWMFYIERVPVFWTLSISWIFFFFLDDWNIIFDYFTLLKGRMILIHQLKILLSNLLMQILCTVSYWINIGKLPALTFVIISSFFLISKSSMATSSKNN